MPSGTLVATRMEAYSTCNSPIDNAVDNGYGCMCVHVFLQLLSHSSAGGNRNIGSPVLFALLQSLAEFDIY